MPIATKGEFWFVKRSKLHGRGLFARKDIPKGTKIIEYRGLRIPESELPDVDESKPEAYHTVIFSLDDGTMIDASRKGNAAQYANHSCSPNSDTIEEDGRIYIRSLRKIRRGEEILYDYHLYLAGPFNRDWLVDYACHCGARKCRKIMLDRKIPKKFTSKS
ncbi:MAG: SET domain-containing protein-lysine N-methyltransferase [Calditrichaeota bacterium]|nr:SET domain-containing protein-lysine N-methyltransferase [Calditrichota bacterium]